MNILSMCLTSIVLFLLFLGTNYLIDSKVNHSFPSIFDLLDHEELLKKEEYSKLPKYILNNCSLIVFDSSENMIYASDNEIKENLNYDDISFIPDSDYNIYYEVSKNYTNETIELYIQRYEYDYENNQETMTGYCSVDENNKIIDGTIFKDKTYLSDREIELLQGIYDSDKDIIKYCYTADDGEIHTLAFVSPIFSYITYHKIQRQANMTWLLLIPIILILLIVQSYILSKLEKKSLLPLQNAMISYSNGEEALLNKDDVPIEFETTVTTFNQLISSLKTMQNEKHRMIADISHDLRTPLTVIKGYSHAFLEGMIPEEKKNAYMEVICQKSDMCGNLIDTLVEYTKLEHPEYVIKKRQENISELCRSYLAENYTEMELSGIKLKVDIPSQDITIECDRNMIYRLFGNIISNTIKYSDGNTEMTFKLRDSDSYVYIYIFDTGQGIPKEISSKIFDPFITGNETRKSGKGIGLGLSISKKIAELHGGTISLMEYSEEEKGTKFKITLHK